MTGHKLDYMFDPDSVAVIGASKSPEKWGASILKHIIEGGYEGDIYPINPHEEKIQGLEVYQSVLDVPNDIDLAVIVTPKEVVPTVIEECVDEGVETAVVISSGFGEASDGRSEAEERIAEIAREGGLRFAGPNCMGIFSARADLRALMIDVIPKEGNVSFISQSGNLGIQTLDRGYMNNLGFDMFVSSGNEADLGCEDYIDYFREKSSTESILAYIEGVKDGDKFFKVSKKTTPVKPIIIYNSGETEAGRKAAQSHTGKMGGSKKIFDGVFKQTGIIKAELTDEMVEYAMAFNQPLPRDNEVAIYTRGGGWGVVVADLCNKYGIKTPDPPERILKKLDEILPFYWSRGNPIDDVATTDPSAQFEIIEQLKEWDIGGVIILGGVGRFWIDRAIESGYSEDLVMETHMELMDEIIELSEDKPVVTVAFKAFDETDTVKKLRNNKIPVYYSPESGVKAYRKLIEYKNFLDSLEKYGHSK